MKFPLEQDLLSTPDGQQAGLPKAAAGCTQSMKAEPHVRPVALSNGPYLLNGDFFIPPKAIAAVKRMLLLHLVRK